MKTTESGEISFCFFNVSGGMRTHSIFIFSVFGGMRTHSIFIFSFFGGMRTHSIFIFNVFGGMRIHSIFIFNVFGGMRTHSIFIFSVSGGMRIHSSQFSPFLLFIICKSIDFLPIALQDRSEPAFDNGFRAARGLINPGFRYIIGTMYSIFKTRLNQAGSRLIKPAKIEDRIQ